MWVVFSNFENNDKSSSQSKILHFEVQVDESTLRSFKSEKVLSLCLFFLVKGVKSVW